jgi:hypothetical protein
MVIKNKTTQEEVTKMDRRWEVWGGKRGVEEETSRFRTLLREYVFVSKEVSALNGARGELGQKIEKALRNKDLLNAIREEGGMVGLCGKPEDVNYLLTVFYDECSVIVIKDLGLNSKRINEVEEQLNKIGIGINKFSVISNDRIGKFLVQESGKDPQILAIVKKLIEEGIATEATHVKVTPIKNAAHRLRS